MSDSVTVGALLLFFSIAGVGYLLLRGHHHGHHRGVVVFSVLAGLIIGVTSSCGTTIADGIGSGVSEGTQLTSHVQGSR